MIQDPERDDEADTAAGELRDLGRLSAWLAHEINNPLGGLQNAFVLIRDAVPSSHPHFKYVGAIEREIARMAALTQRFQHAYASGGERNPPMPIARAIADALHALKPLCLARRVEVDVNISPSATSERVASDLCGRTIRHLVQHGVESAPPDSIVEFRVWREAGLLWLAIPEPEQDGQLPRAAVAGPPGLALQLVRNLVAALDGKITITAASDGGHEIRAAIPTPGTATEAE